MGRTSRSNKEIKYFLISFVDLFGTMRAKIVPATAIDDVAKSGAGFAGFAAWFDMTPADPDVLVTPRLGQRHPTAVEAGGGLGYGRSRHGRGRVDAKSPTGSQARDRRGGRAGFRAENWRGMRVLPDRAGRTLDLRRRRSAGQALLRSASADAPLRCGCRDLRRNDRSSAGTRTRTITRMPTASLK